MKEKKPFKLNVKKGKHFTTYEYMANPKKIVVDKKKK